MSRIKRQKVANLTEAESAPCHTDNASDWNNLSPLIVDRVGKAIKEKGYWRNEFRALRSLNKHWCSCLNSQVTCVHPADNRTITPADIRSLLKFPRLESIDIFPFVFADTSNGQDLLLTENWWYRVDKSEQKRRLMDVLNVMAEIPNLRELLIDERLFIMEESFLDNQVLNLFKKLQLVSAKFRYRLGFGYPSENRTILPWPFASARLSKMFEMHEEYSFLKNLTKFDAREDIYFHNIHKDYYDILSLGKSCRKCLSFGCLVNEFNDFCQIGHIESIDIDYIYTATDMNCFFDMPTLRHFSLIWNTEVMTGYRYEESSEAMKSSLRELLSLSDKLQLVSVGLTFDWEILETSQAPVRGLENLKCIRISSADPRCLKIFRSLPNLEFLDIELGWDCYCPSTLESEELWSYMGRLDTVEGRFLNNLKGLRIDNRYTFCQTDIASICKLQNLLVLSLHEETIFHFEDLNQLTSMPNLKYLEFRGDSFNHRLLSLPSLEILKQLEAVYVDLKEYEFTASQLSAIIKKINPVAPNLKFIALKLDFYDMYKELGFESD